MASKYLPHQIEKASEVMTTLKHKGMAMLWGAPRSGKTRTAIRVCELSAKKRILFITKKAAIPGIERELLSVEAVKHYHVTNYEQASKLDASDYDFVILDESHNLNGTGRPKKKHKELRELCYTKPCLLMSGTPAIEKLLAIYYQLSVTQYSPFDQYASFFKFFKEYGIPSTIRINGREIEQYNRARPELAEALEPYVVRMTQADAGINIERKDVVHEVHLRADTRRLLDVVMQDCVAEIQGTTYGFDSDMAVRAAVHQIETGAVLLNDEIVELPNCEVVDYIKANFTGSLALMAHYRATREKIAKHIPEADVFSSVSHCEGTDLTDYDNFIIVNSDYSGAKFVQRLERNTRLDLKRQPVVHHIITDGGVSASVYKALQKKEDFNIQRFRGLRARAGATEEDT